MTLRVDPTTLADLEIFADAGGRGGVFAMIDRTETEAGSRALRRRLAAPHSEPAAIRRTQEAVRFFAGHADLRVPGRGAGEAVALYLDSNIDVGRARSLPGRFVEATWIRLRWAELAREIRRGVEATRSWLGMATTCARSLSAVDPPDEVRALADRILDAARDVPLHAPRTPSGLMEIDRVYRFRSRAQLVAIAESLAEIDALRAMGRATERLGWRMPHVVEEDGFRLDAEDARHPFVERAVANPVRLEPHAPVLFLTGPNMAGKTTYLRTAALAVLLAQTGMGVPAERMTLAPAEALLTSLNASDNLRAGLSYFLSEVVRVREAAEQLAEGRRCFVLFDEVFKGTNVKDALEASTAVIRGFALAKRSACVFSSHLVELVPALSDTGRVLFRHFEGHVEGDVVTYGYRLREGASGQRLGMRLLAEARVPELLERIARDGRD